jgi:uncharacterized membrane protein
MKNRKKLNISLKITMLLISLFSIVTPVFAQGIGEKVGTSLTTNLNALIPAALLLIGIYFIFTRDWMKMMSFIAIALLIAIFTNWEWVKSIAGKAYTAFMA